ncbi:MAG TPA: hypothetical protein VFH33_03805 [Candidatus Krumholzibacteria bacterium]|nr:hypothetical protein [Candidatus Krumholzibacteria bacterium]
MRRQLVLLALGAMLVGCKPQHPVNVFVDPKFDDADANGQKAVQKIAVLECTSSLAHADDPDNLAPQTFSRFLMPALNGRTDYKFIAAQTVDYAIAKVSTPEQYQKMLKAYAMSDKPNMEYLKPLAAELNCDAFLIPVVDLWQKDEVDIKENATPTTYVGATITIISVSDGAILFRCTDEDYAEGASNEAGDRSVVASKSGAVYSDLGAKTHRAPPFEDVAGKVAASLASGLPTR